MVPLCLFAVKSFFIGVGIVIVAQYIWNKIYEEPPTDSASC